MQTVLISVLAFIGSMGVTLLARQLTTTVSIIGDFIRLKLSENPGIAFGIRLPEIWQEALIGIALLLVCYAARGAIGILQRAGFGLIIGGAFANLADRFGNGMVTDYIAIGTFPVFNAADSCITIGVGLLLLDAFLTHKTR